MLYCHLWPVRLYHILLHFLIKAWFLENDLLKIKCLFWFSLQLLSETFLILWRIERDMITNVYWSSCKVSVIIVRFLWNFSLSEDFRKNIWISNFTKIRAVGAESFYADGQTDRHDEGNIRFSQFFESAKNILECKGLKRIMATQFGGTTSRLRTRSLNR